MLPLEVVGPGGSLSTALIATPYGRDASWRVSWQPATATAAAAYSCDRATAALVQRLGSGWRRQRRSGPVSSATDSKLSFDRYRFLAIRLVFVYVYQFVINSASFILLEFVIVGQ